MKIRRIFEALGFTAIAASVVGCIKVMYGCPHADYEIKGAVQDAMGNPIKGIKVTPEELGCDPDTTKADGSFSFNGSDMIGVADEITLRVEDIDGAENGLYKSKEVSVPMSQTKKGDGDWYEGAYAGEVTVTLESEAE